MKKKIETDNAAQHAENEKLEHEPQEALVQVRQQISYELEQIKGLLEERFEALRKLNLHLHDPGQVLTELQQVIEQEKNKQGKTDQNRLQFAQNLIEFWQCEVNLTDLLKNTRARLQTTYQAKDLDLAELFLMDRQYREEYEEYRVRQETALQKMEQLGKQAGLSNLSSWEIPTTSGAGLIDSLLFRWPRETHQQWYNVISALPYQALREVLAQNKFGQNENSPWPTANLARAGAHGYVQLRPPVVDEQPLAQPEELDRWVQIMWQQREELDDLDADALDLLCHIWLQQARKPEDAAVGDVDQFLEMRGLEKKQSGQGRMGGYRPQQRTEMLKALSHIQSLWLNMGQVEFYQPQGTTGRRRKVVVQEVQSRAFVVTDRMGQLKMDGYMDVQRFIFQPGKLFAQFLFGPGRQTALLSARAVQYDPYRHKWEKRLARYLSWQWRIQAGHGDYSRPYRVATLIEAAGEELNTRYPAKTRDRMEEALDRLQEDGVIAAWHYDAGRWNEKLAELRGWGQSWLQATILLEPPEAIREAYKSIESHAPKSSKSVKAASRKPVEISETAFGLPSISNVVPVHKASVVNNRSIKERRKKLGLSQSQVAEQLGITAAYLSGLERDLERPSNDLQKRIKQWLENNQ